MSLIEKLKAELQRLKSEAARNADICFSADSYGEGENWDGKTEAYDKVLSIIQELERNEKHDREV